MLDTFIKFTKKWEGGLSRDTHDSASAYPNPLTHRNKTGWHTNKGITYKVWESVYGEDKARDFFKMPDKMWWKIMKTRYWDAVKGDLLPVSIAIYTTGIAWGSGPRKGRTTLQWGVNRIL